MAGGYLGGANGGGFLYPSVQGGGGGGSVNSVTAGDTSITIGGTASDPTVAINTANANTWTALQTKDITDTANTAVTDTLVLRHTLSSGAAGAGMGASVLISLPDAGAAAGASEDACRYGTRWVDATAGSEDSEFFVQTRAAGGALADALVVARTGASAAIVATGVSGPNTSFVLGTPSVPVYRMNISSIAGRVDFFGNTSRPTTAFTQSASTSGVAPLILWQSANHTGQTASTEIRGLELSTSTRTWATGAIASQREVAFNGLTYAFAGASTITTAATLYATPPIAGTNASITDAYSAWFSAKIRVDSAVALGGGAAPTLGTIGGSGPATAAQNEWIAIDTQNGRRWVPAWA